EVVFGARVVSVEEAPDGRLRVRFTRPGDGEREVLARGAVGAWGRWNALDRALDRRFARGSRRFFGWSADYDGGEGALRGQARLYLFPGGYCGLSPIEEGAVHLAGVIAEAALRRLSPGWDSVVAHARRGNADLDRDMAGLSPPGDAGFLGTGPVFFTRKPAAEGGLLMAGDAAGVLDPFLGEGLSVALSSGLLAAETLERALSGKIALQEAPRYYARAWSERFAGRTRRGAACRALMLHPTAARVAAALAGERLVRLALGSVGRRKGSLALTRSG
ncbi:MAG: NAD(P)/FAD-dependent oxidoreductase, partial [Syntrophomonadaceae bacterium]